MTIVGRAVERTEESSEDKREVMARAAMMALLEKLAYIRRRCGSRERESGARFLARGHWDLKIAIGSWRQTPDVLSSPQLQENIGNI